MHLTVYLLWILAAVGIGAGQDEVTADDELLSLKPAGGTFVKPQGQSIMFTCEVSNYKDGVDYDIKWIGGNNQEISDPSGSRMYIEEDGSNMKKLYITRIEEGDAGTYTCQATINGEQHQQTAKLNIFKDITFDNAPSPQNPRIYTDALISCVVSGEPKPQVSWRFNGKRLNVHAVDGRYVLMEGKGMTIKNVTQNDDGEYICRAEVNADGRYNEKKITVKVHIPPAIITSPGNVEGVDGESVTIRCVATGLPKPKYEFIKGTETMQLQSTDRIIVDNDEGTIQFTKLIKSADEDQYTCRALNDVDHDSAVGHLRVYAKPEIFALADVTETETGTATLICQSRGDPAPDMTFQKLGQQTPYESGTNDDGRIVVSKTEGTLQMVISDLQSTDAARYVCRSHNAHGEHEMTATLTVNYAPRFVDGQQNEAYTWAGRTSNISCQANGSPVPSLQWMRGDHMLSNNDTYQIFDMGSTSHLQITVREADQSWIYSIYTCKAMNQLNSKEFNIDVKRASVPNIPSAVNTSQVSPTSAVLSIEEPEEDGGMPVVGYIVEFNDNVIDFTTDQLVKLTNLKPDTTYTVSIRAKNEVGAGNPSELTFTTEPTRKPYPIVIESGATGSLPYNYKLSWASPDTGGSPILSYEIKHREVTLAEWKVEHLTENSKRPRIQHEFTNLKEQTEYEVEIKAQNDIGWSDVNERFTFTTSKDPDATTTTTTTTTIPTTTVVVPAEIPESYYEITKPANTIEAIIGASETKSASASMSFGTVIGVVAIVMVIALVIVDLSCFSVNKCGLTWSICGAVRGGKKSKSVQPKVDLEGGESEKMLKEQPVDCNPPGIDSSKSLLVTEIDEGQNSLDAPARHEEIPLRENLISKETDIDEEVEKLG